MKKLTLTILTALACAAAAAQSATGRGFTPSTVRPGEPADYTIVLNGLQAQIDLNKIPVPDGLQYAGSGRSERISITGGSGAVRETVIDLKFIPTRAGSFEIKPWQLSAGGKSYEIPAATLTADPNAPQTLRAGNASGMPDPFDEFDALFSSAFGGAPLPSRAASRAEPVEEIDLSRETSLALELPKGKIYVGEAVPCRVVVKFSRKIFEAGYVVNRLVPSLKSGDAFVCPGFLKEGRRTASSDDFEEVTFDTVITPLKAGEFDIQFEADAVVTSPGRFRRMSFFSMADPFGEARQFSLGMMPVKISALELPKDGMPANFTGAIGSFKIDPPKLDESALSVGEPCTMSVSVSGRGNFERMSPPSLSGTEGWKEYKPKSSFTDSSDGYAFSGTKTFEYTLVPQKPDLAQTPAAEFSYFNSAAGKYETLRAGPAPVSVAPSKGYARRMQEAEEAKAEKAPDPLAVVSGRPAGGGTTQMASSPAFWAAQVVLLGAVAAFIISRRRKNRLESDPRYARSQAAKAGLKKSLSAAKSAAARGDAATFFKAAAESVQNAVASSGDFEARAVTLGDALEFIAKKGAPEGVSGDAKTFFEGADAIAFGGYSPETGELGTLCTKLESLCSDISQ